MILYIISVQSGQAGATQLNFSGPLIRPLPLLVPPQEIQQRFASDMLLIGEVREAQALCRESIKGLDPSLAQMVFQEA